MEACIEARLSRERTARRRSLLRQGPRREAERTVRSEVVAFRDVLRGEGVGRQDAAELLGLNVRTLTEWGRRERLGELQACARGRPLWRSSVATRNQLIVSIRDCGPHTGVEKLRSLSPKMPRSEISDILWRYRQVDRKRHSLLLHELEWTTPVVVWAMDHAVPPEPVDGVYRAILSVRDLASGEPLLWQPLPDMTAEETLGALAALFEERGRPLALKSDNGPAFRSELLMDDLRARGIHQLFSPRWTPQYNGACESGIRHLKRQTEYEARRRGRPGQWRGEDLERARAVRAFLAGARPQEPLSEEVRLAFGRTVREKELEVEQDLGYARMEGDVGVKTKIKRTALSRALREHGFLHIKRRRVPLPKCQLFSAKIS